MTLFHPEMINTIPHDTDKLHFILCFFPLFLIYATLIVALSELVLIYFTLRWMPRLVTQPSFLLLPCLLTTIFNSELSHKITRFSFCGFVLLFCFVFVHVGKKTRKTLPASSTLQMTVIHSCYIHFDNSCGVHAKIDVIIPFCVSSWDEKSKM